MGSVPTARRDGQTLTDRHRADPVKAGGVHYTPQPLAEFVAEHAAAELNGLASLRVLDPACGDGVLLASAAQALPAGASVRLYGLDVDGVAAQEAQSRLDLLPANVTSVVDKGDFIDLVMDERERTERLFSSSPSSMALRNQFDLVIANPPYVRTQVLGAERARRMAVDFGLTGRVDLYHAFVVAMAATLRSGGVLALLCSNRFLTTKSGATLRGLLRDQFEIISVFDLGDTKTFEAAVLPAVVIARRSEAGTAQFPMASIYEDRDQSRADVEQGSVFEALSAGAEGIVSVEGAQYEVRRSQVDTADLRKPWVPMVGAGDWVRRVDSAATMRFGDVAKLKVGVKTTADAVFIREDWTDQEPIPEAGLLRPLLTHHVARRWRAEVPTKQILYPYDITAASRVPVDLGEWPATMAYLEQHRERLAGRKYVVEGGRQWWEIWVPQRPSAWAAPKLVFPDISEDPRFFYDRTGAVVNGDCYWTPATNERWAWLMMAVANSELGRRYYDAVCGNKLYSGRRRYMSQYVERFPIPDPTQPVADRIVETVKELITTTSRDRITDLEAQIDVLVATSFGVE